MLKLQIVIGSTRPGRNADHVIPWLVRRAEEHGTFDVQVLDLRDWRLPLFQETAATVGDRSNPTYSEPIVREWNQTIKQGDAHLFLTSEFNRSVPGELKNAIDTVYASHAFRNKPAGFVGYSVSIVGGARAVEHLVHISVEAEMVPLRNSVIIAQVQNAFEGGHPKNPATEVALTTLLEDLTWWATILHEARASGELKPAAQRVRD